MSSESIDISQASSPGNTECDAIGAKTSEPELPASNAGRKGPGVGRKAPGVNGGAYGAYGRNLGELETGFFGSNEVVDETVKSQRIEHHRVDDLDILEEHYKIGKKLGQGSFGMVRVVEHKITGLSFACKTIKKKLGSTSSYEQLQREVSIMKKVKHKHIVQLKEVPQSSPKEQEDLIKPLYNSCKGGELVQKIRTRRYCTEGEVRVIIQRLLEVIAYLHDHGIVHRDIKPENILLSLNDPLDQFNIKVSDFGLATFTDACTMMENVAGTPMYMAPEILKNLGYSSQCDIWSMGVMMYLLLCGYKKDIEFQLHKYITEGHIVYPDDLFQEISHDAQSLCDAMLRFDPAKRITAREALGHTWLTGEVKDSPLSANVLDLMRSYNAEQRLRKIFLTVRAAIRFLARKSGRSGVTVSHDSIVGLSALSIGSSSVSHGSESTSVASGSASRKASSGPTGIGPSIYRSTEGSEGSKSRIGQSKGPRAEGITTPSIVSGPLRPAKLASIVTASPVSGESHGSPSPVSKTPNKSPLPNCLINASRHRAIPAGQKDPGTPDKATQQQRKSYQHSSMSSHATFHGTASTPPSSTQPRTSSFSLNEHEPKATSGQRKTVTTAAMTPETTTTVRGVSVQKAKSSAPRRVSTPAANFRIGELK